MDYTLYDVRNVNGQPTLARIDEGVTPPLGPWEKYERWFQERIAKLRTERELHQVVAWMHTPDSEWAFTGMELARDGGGGLFRILIHS